MFYSESDAFLCDRWLSRSDINDKYSHHSRKSVPKSSITHYNWTIGIKKEKQVRRSPYTNPLQASWWNKSPG